MFRKPKKGKSSLFRQGKNKKRSVDKVNDSNDNNDADNISNTNEKRRKKFRKRPSTSDEDEVGGSGGDHIRNDNDNGYWCIMDEICNKKKCMDMIISNTVVDLFLHNEDIIFLKGIDNLRIEIPIISFGTCDNLFELNHMKYSLNKNKKMYNF